MFERGKIRNEAYASILKNFTGLRRHRNITPTDIDGILEYNGKAFIILEGKFGNTQMPHGQQKCFESICNAIESGGKNACCIVFSHLAKPGDQIDVSTCIVTKVYFENKWHPGSKNNTNRTVLQVVEAFEQNLIKKGIDI